MHEKSIAEIDLSTLTHPRKFHPSPAAWEDQVLYFLLVDRFSDGHEKGGFRTNEGKPAHGGKTPLFDAKTDENSAVRTRTGAEKWRDAGGKFVGGTIKGLTSKLGYLQRLGVTAIWVSPVWKQCAFDDHSYHGYGTQNFLDVEPRFGTRDELQELVQTAHDMGIYVVLDIILNHAGNVFAYDPDAETLFKADGEYPVKGWRDKEGKPTLPFGPIDEKKHASVWPDGAVWPRELQTPESFNRKGEMRDWDAVPESVEGDFFGFKDIHLGHYDGDRFVPSGALKTLTDVFKFWMALTDIDGFRVDTLKNMGAGAARFFADEIHAWAHHLGKKNFYLFGEITGEDARATDEMLTSFGVDGAFWLGTVPLSLRDVVTGRRGAPAYFDLHRGSTEEAKNGGAMAWYRGHYACFFDDHDQVGSDTKHRFASEFIGDKKCAEQTGLRAIGVTATSLGIPASIMGPSRDSTVTRFRPKAGTIMSGKPCSAVPLVPLAVTTGTASMKNHACIRKRRQSSRFAPKKRHCGRAISFCGRFLMTVTLLLTQFLPKKGTTVNPIAVSWHGRGLSAVSRSFVRSIPTMRIRRLHG